MLIKFEDNEYEFSLENIDVQQAETVYDKVALTLLGIEEGLSIGHPGAMKAVYWLMLAQNGINVPFETINFKIIPFSQACGKAREVEEAEQAKLAKQRKPSTGPKRAPAAKANSQTSTPSDSLTE